MRPETIEDRIRYDHKKARQLQRDRGIGYPGIVSDRFMTLARKYKMPVREIKRIVGRKANPNDCTVYFYVEFPERKGWVESTDLPERAAWNHAYNLEQGRDTMFKQPLEFAWVFDRKTGKPLPFERMPADKPLRGRWIRTKEIEMAYA